MSQLQQELAKEGHPIEIATADASSAADMDKVAQLTRAIMMPPRRTCVPVLMRIPLAVMVAATVAISCAAQTPPPPAGSGFSGTRALEDTRKLVAIGPRVAGTPLDLGLGIQNAFDQRLATPGSEEHRQSAIPEDPRLIWIRIGAHL